MSLRVIHIEDSDDDAELLRVQLRRAGFDAHIQRVQSAPEFLAVLKDAQWDVVVADHLVPGFEAPHALELLRGQNLDLPFVVMSGAVSHDVAVEMMRAGAHDFVSKETPARLEPIIRRELRAAENRRARRRAEAERESVFADRERILTQLEAANRAKDEFLAMLGHELRNPLAPIVTALQLLKLRGDGRPSREYAIIERQVNHLTRLVDDLLDVAKIARGKVELKTRTLDLAEVVAKGVEMASPMFEHRAHHFRIDALPRTIFVNGDEARLAQVVANLLTNACRYTNPGGDIALTLGAEGESAVIRVRDNGIGIEAELLPRIFDLFVQGSRPLARSEGGLGLGLALVRNLVKLHGGTVAVESEGKERGSQFTVRLPLVAAEVTEVQKRVAADARPRDDAAVRRGRVLLVDDNEDSVEMLAEVVRMEGYDVEVAHDGPSALALLDRIEPHAIVLDIGLPIMDGYEVARKIRTRPSLLRTRLIALTGYGQASDRERTLGVGFDAHLVKPIDVRQLIDAITNGAPAKPAG